jgi:hypothetical protein
MPTTPQNGETATQVTHNLIIHYKDRLYRLALLVTGSPSAAAERLIAAFASLSPTSTDPELDLARALLPSQHEKRRLLRWLAQLKRSTDTWKPDPSVLGRANLSADKARTLLKILADASLEARLQLGLHTLLGLPADTAARPEGAASSEPGKTTRSSIEELIELRCTVALALERIPATTEHPMVLRIARFLAGRLEGDAAVQTRALLLSSVEARAIRDGLLATDSLLQRALPLLYAAAPPPDLSERLLDQIDGPHSHTLNPKQLRFLAVGSVVLLVLLLLIIPEFTRNQSRGAASATATTPLTPAELLETAIHRFEHPPVQQGILHEVFTGELHGQLWSLERWYDYGSRSRVKVVVTIEGEDQPLYALASDGESQVQFRLPADSFPGSQRQTMGIDVTTSAQELAAFWPTLRQQPDFLSIFGRRFFAIEPLDLGHFYLAQASNAELATLGSANIDGRAAQMVTYTTDQPFPLQFERFGDVRDTPLEPAPSQVILTIDLRTYTLLDVTVVAQSDSAAIAQHPWRATTVAIESTTPPDLFTLAPADLQETFTGLLSVRSPFIYSFGEEPLSLDEALRVADETVYMPSQLPDPAIRGAVFNMYTELLFLYEGPFHSLIVGRSSGEDFANFESEERVANGFRYRLASTEEVPYPDMHLVVVNPPNDPTDTIIIAYMAPYESPQTVEASLDTIIGSLQPLTEENLNTLGQHFYQPNRRGAQANPQSAQQPRP